jgi:hypothetical protein
MQKCREAEKSKFPMPTHTTLTAKSGYGGKAKFIQQLGSSYMKQNISSASRKIISYLHSHEKAHCFQH